MVTALKATGFGVACALAVGCVSCVKAAAFECMSNLECARSDSPGTCESVGFCSFPDSSCSSGHRFAELSGSYSNQCVGNLDGGLIDAAPRDGLGCPVGYAVVTGAANRAYRKLASSGQWAQQRDACLGDGANVYLAVPDDAIELQAIVTFAGDDIWIGVEDTVNEGTFVTVLGTAATFLPWASGEPDDAQNSDCVEALSASARLDDRRCSTSYTAVCECEP